MHEEWFGQKNDAERGQQSRRHHGDLDGHAAGRKPSQEPFGAGVVWNVGRGMTDLGQGFCQLPTPRELARPLHGHVSHARPQIRQGRIRLVEKPA